MPGELALRQTEAQLVSRRCADDQIPAPRRSVVDLEHRVIA